MKEIDKKFIEDVEKSHFRTNTDTGANMNAMFIWNTVREHVGLPRITIDSLPAFCVTHQKYHVINPDYGCAREEKTK